jgi:NADH-quinone oxidoreductase subunit N
VLAIAIRRRHDLPFGLALAATVVSFLALWPASDVGPRRVTLLFIIDGYALFYVGLILAATIFVLLLSHG